MVLSCHFWGAVWDIPPARSHKSLKSQHKEEKARKGEWKRNSFTGHVSVLDDTGMLHAFPAQLAPMIWSITAFLFQKLVCIPSCLLSGARKSLTAVLWHVKLPESNTLLWVRTQTLHSYLRELGCPVPLPAAQHRAPHTGSARRRGTRLTLSTDKSLSTTAWVCLHDKSLSSSGQSDLELLCEKSGFSCNIAGSASWRASAKCQALRSSRLQRVPFFQAAPRGAAEGRQDRRVQLSSLPSSATHLLWDVPDPFSPCFGTTSVEIW